MPIKNGIKQYKENAIYHIYNRGIDAKEVFKDDQDYSFFKECLKRYLLMGKTEKESRYKVERPYLQRRREKMNLNTEIELLAYCLLTDHFHLLVYQHNRQGITKLMRRIMTSYVMYFNQKYKRRGVLFESVYRAVIVDDPEFVLRISKFIHMNPAPKVTKRFGIVETTSATLPEYYPHSSYATYVGDVTDGEWVKTEKVTQCLDRLYGGGCDYKEYMDHKDEAEGVSKFSEWNKLKLD